MDLTIADVASMLNVSETTIRHWVIEGRLPAYRIENQWRFNRMEVEDSIMTNRIPNNGETQNQTSSSSTIGNLQFSLYRALHKGRVLLNVLGKTKEELIRNSVEAISHELKVDGIVLTDLLLSREKLQSTGVGHGIGLPHTRDFLLSSHQDIVVVAFPQEAIPYDSLDNQPVTTLFFLFASSDKRHLHLLAKLAHFSNNEAAREFLLKKPTKEELLDFIRQWEAQLTSSSLQTGTEQYTDAK